MRVLYVGVHSGRGWRTEYWVHKALKRVGCKVKLYNYRRKRKRFKDQEKCNLDLLNTEKKFRPDLILVQRADNCPPELFANLKSKKVLWSTEPICRNRDIDQLFEADCFDHYFVHTFSCLNRINEEFQAISNKTSRLEYGCPPELIKKPTEKKKTVAIFNRSLSPRRNSWLEKLTGIVQIIEGRFGRAYFKDIRNALISVNIHYGEESVDDFETGIFEAMAQGTLVLTESVDTRVVKELGLENSIVIVSNPDEMKERLNFYESNKSEAFSIINNAHDAIQKNRWDDRMNQILSTVGLSA